MGTFSHTDALLSFYLRFIIFKCNTVGNSLLLLQRRSGTGGNALAESVYHAAVLGVACDKAGDREIIRTDD